MSRHDDTAAAMLDIVVNGQAHTFVACSTLANLIEWLEIRNRQAGARISSIPMLLMFKSGQVHGTQIGAVGKPQLAQLIDKAL